MDVFVLKRGVRVLSSRFRLNLSILERISRCDGIYLWIFLYIRQMIRFLLILFQGTAVIERRVITLIMILKTI